ncbi:hydroxyacid dehydrogenase [Candidatus Woesearchaeota archaeon]|nr:hydroxyacid dehydrogenase [Candidatus Woesearchaeota archaeon]
MTKLFFFDVDEKEQAVLSRELQGSKNYELSFDPQSLDINTASHASAAEGIGIFIQSKITSDILKHLPKVKIIATMSTGFDHIDLKACKAQSITVCNVPSYGDNTVAEYAFCLILALSRKLKPTLDRVEKGFFSRTGLIGTDIKGKTLGLIGTGRIGSFMAKLGTAFEMKVIAYDVNPDNRLKEKYGIEFMNLDEVLAKADVVSLHVPYLNSTHHLINKERLRLCKPTVLLINTSRGKVVDTKAVSSALRENRLGGVALDTFEGENIWIEEEFLKQDDLPAVTLKEAMESFSIMRSERAILTPHNAFNTNEALERILTTSAENIKSFFVGHPQNVVNISSGEEER